MIPAVLSTRPAGADDPLVAALRGCGFRCLAVPTVTTAPAASSEALAATLAALDPGSWVAVTSRRGAEAMVAARAILGPLAPDLRWAAVSEATARPLREAGVPDVVLGTGTGSSVAEAIEPGASLDGVTVLLPRADAASGELPARLRARGASVRELVAYRTVEAPGESRQPLAAALSDPALVAIVFASGSAVRGLLALAGPAGRARLAEIALVSIGPSTSAELRRLHLRVAAQATGPTVPQLVSAVVRGLPAPPRLVVSDRAEPGREAAAASTAGVAAAPPRHRR